MGIKQYLLLATLFVFVLSPQSAFAQSSVVSPTDAEQKMQLYRDQISVYRDAERTFDVSKGQYIKLQTLASLEEAVLGTRNVLLARSKVLIQYFELLHDELSAQHGVNLQEKEEVLSRLKNQLTYLQQHQDQVLLANDRDALAAVVLDFDEHQELLEDAVYRARTLTAIGKVQTVNDKARALLEDIKKEHAKEPVNTSISAQRDRAYAETTKHIDQTEAEILEIMDSGYNRVANSFTKSRFNQILDDLSDPYVTAQKSLGFLKELLSL